MTQIGDILLFKEYRQINGGGNSGMQGQYWDEYCIRHGLSRKALLPAAEKLARKFAASAPELEYSLLVLLRRIPKSGIVGPSGFFKRPAWIWMLRRFLVLPFRSIHVMMDQGLKSAVATLPVLHRLVWN